MTRTITVPAIDDTAEPVNMNLVSYENLVRTSQTMDAAQGVSESRYTDLNGDPLNPPQFVVRSQRIPKSKSGAVKGLAAINCVAHIVDDVAGTTETYPLSFTAGFNAGSGEIPAATILAGMLSALHLLISDVTAGVPDPSVTKFLLLGITDIHA